VVSQEKRKKLYTGIVVSKKMNKTATVLVEHVYKHAVVGKVLRKKRKFHVDDPANVSTVGDIISFYEGRPVSKMKYMHFCEVIRKGIDQKDLHLEVKDS